MKIKEQTIKALDELTEADLMLVNDMKAVFHPDYIKRLNGRFIKEGKNKLAIAEQLREDIQGDDNLWSGTP